MKKLFTVLMTMGLCLGLTGVAMAAANDTQTVNYEVTAINEINIDNDAVTLQVNTAVAGVVPTQATDSTTYDITTNCGVAAKKITASLNTAMAAGLTLQINMTAPSTGAGGGALTLTDEDVDAVTAIGGVAEADIAIDYTLDATIAAGVVAAANKTITLTIVNN